MISASALSDWLSRELGRDDLAASLRSLLANESLDDDTRLLHFCHELSRELPPIWRGRELSESNLDSAAQAALGGDRTSLEWLQSLTDNRAFDFYGRRQYHNVTALQRRFTQYQTEYMAAWDTVIAAGAPDSARPTQENTLALATRLACSDAVRTAVRQQSRHLLDPHTILLREEWFLLFGTDPAQINDSQLSVLQHLDGVSMLSEHNLQSLDELGNVNLELARTRVLFPAGQRRLMNSLVVRAGTTVATVRPGQVHRPPHPRTFGDWLHETSERAYAGMGRGLRQLLARVLPAQPPIDLSLEGRLVRLTAAGQELDSPVQDEFYLTRLSWRGPESLTLKLRLSHFGGPFAPTKLLTPALPAQGSMLVLLTSDTRIQLIGRRRWFERRTRTAPIAIRFNRIARLRFPLRGLHRFQYFIRTVQAALRAAKAPLGQAVSSLRPHDSQGPLRPLRSLLRPFGEVFHTPPLTKLEKRIERTLRNAFRQAP